MKNLLLGLILLLVCNSQDSTDVLIPVDAVRLSQLINNSQERHKLRAENAKLDSAYRSAVNAFMQVDSVQLQLRSLMGNAQKVIEEKTLESEAWHETAEFFEKKYKFAGDVAISVSIGSAVGLGSQDVLAGIGCGSVTFILQRLNVLRLKL